MGEASTGVPFDAFRAKHRGQSRERFLDQVVVPHLAVPSQTTSASAGGWGYGTVVDGAMDAATAMKALEALEAQERQGADSLEGKVLHPVRKRGAAGNVPGLMIMVGRSGVSDIALDDGHVSKFHAYFKLTKGEWVVCDAQSAYGTFVNDRRAPTTGGLAVASGDRIRFSDDLTAVFWSPEDLFEKIAD